ncbi:MAG TPA: PAS domain S-box protein [Bryobacteraceae bacterium]|nr:PAS domain S-box protein [Bryobacteraceae bacterium]
MNRAVNPKPRRNHTSLADLCPASDLTRFLESAAFPIQCVSPNGLILWANQATLDLLGYSQDEYVGSNMGDFFTESMAASDMLHRLRTREGLAESQATMRARDGTPRYVSITSKPDSGDIQFVEIRPLDSVRQRLAAIVDSCDDAIISKDLSGIILSWNRGAERIFGYRADEVIGRPISILAAPDRMSEMPQILDRIRRGEQVDHYQTVRRRKDGYLIDVSLTVSPLRNEAGEIVGASKVARDITAMKRAGEELAAADEQMRLAHQAAHIGSWTLNLANPAKSYWSPEAYEIAGLDSSWRPDFTAWLLRVHEEDRDRVRRTIQDTLLHGSSFAVSYRFIGHDGIERWHESRGNVHRDADGSAAVARGITLDITERQRAQFELQLAKRRVEDILSSIRESFIALDRKWRFTYVNDRVVEGTGCTKEDLIGKSVWDTHLAAKSTDFWPNYHRVMAERIPIRFETFYPLTNQWFEVHAFPTDEGLSALVLDITSRHNADQALRDNEARSRLLAEAGAALVSSLDYEQTLRTVARLAVPSFADWAAVDLMDGEGNLQRVAVEHSDPGRIEFAREFHGKYPPREGDRTMTAIHTGKAFFMAEIPEQLIDETASDREHAAAIRSLGIRSVVVAPMVARGRVLGSLTFATAESGRRYSESDVALAEDLARRAAMAIENARLYKALHENEARLRQIFETAAEGICVTDQKTRILIANPRMAELLGVPNQDLVGRKLLDFVPVEHRDRARKTFQSRIAGDAGPAREYPVQHRDGSWRWLRIHASVLRNEAGQVEGVLGMFSDITELHQHEMALRDSEARFRELANTVPAFVWGAQPDGTVTYFNDRWYAYTGSSPESSLGTRWLTYVHPEDAAATSKAWSEATANGTNYESECRYRDASGDYRWFMARAIPVRDERGIITRWFGTSTDVHEAKRAETDLRRANADLEQFAYSASHDLREPLRMVAIYSQLLQRRYTGKLDAQADQYLALTVAGALRMEALVSDLLAYTQATNSWNEPASLTDAGAVLDQVLSNLKQAIVECRATIESDRLPWLRVQEVHLVQLFQNLLGNALKYRGSEPPLIRITSARQDESWRVCVHDNGIGIAPEYTEQIFGLFKRLHNADAYSGTGLGLAICQKIVHRYGGKIWVESGGPGQGSTFCFTLPGPPAVD